MDMSQFKTIEEFNTWRKDHGIKIPAKDYAKITKYFTSNTVVESKGNKPEETASISPVLVLIMFLLMTLLGVKAGSTGLRKLFL